ncbi:hypothetical protein DITRI_Ditri03aG0195800 [Diplodiscus trichospermus]
MDANQQQKSREKVVDRKQYEEGKKEGIADKKQQQQMSSISPASPPSASSSPSHEFSFTISLHSSSNTVPDKTKTPPSIAIDLTPADDIFFHGHLLPLHLLSHLPVSPRSSTHSLDSFNLPIRELLDDQKPVQTNTNCSKSDSNIRTSISSSNNNKNPDRVGSHNIEGKGRSKSKSFSLFSATRWQKGRDVRETEEKVKHKKKMRFDVVTHVLKKYMRMVRPLLLFRGRRENRHLRRQAYSFSGNLSLRNKKQELKARRGEYYSAPASMRTSPTNSGLLVATTSFPSSTSDSTMEELQAAIQAAIAHCKNSIRGE